MSFSNRSALAVCDVVQWKRDEYRRGFGESANAPSALELVECAAVVPVDDQRSRERSEDLSQSVDEEFPKWKAAEDHLGERHLRNVT